MAIRDILHYPDPRLRNRAEPVDAVDDDVRTLLDDMLETMYAAPGIGLPSSAHPRSALARHSPRCSPCVRSWRAAPASYRKSTEPRRGP